MRACGTVQTPAAKSNSPNRAKRTASARMAVRMISSSSRAGEPSVSRNTGISAGSLANGNAGWCVHSRPSPSLQRQHVRDGVFGGWVVAVRRPAALA